MLSSYQRDWNDQIVLVKGPQPVGHAQHRTGPPLQGGLANQLKHLCQLFRRRRHLFDLDGEQLPVLLQQQVDLPGILVPILFTYCAYMLCDYYY